MRTSAALSTAELYSLASDATKAGSKSFYFATRFFPKHLAQSAHAVYWFCRTTDDIVDECPSREQGQQQLNDWAEMLHRALGGEAHVHPVLDLFAQTVRQHSIPHEYPLDLIAGMQMDLDQARYQNFEELRLFCYRVASVVGLMMSYVIGFQRPEHLTQAVPKAIDLGIALQLTNILRDVGEDLERGRIYLPAEELAQFGYTEADLLAHRRNDAFYELMRFQVARARSFYQSARPGIPLLHEDGRFAVQVAADVYAEILTRIEESHYQVFTQRAVVSARRKYWITASRMAIPMVRHLGRKLVN